MKLSWLASFLIIFSFASCDNDDETLSPITGKWSGDKAEFKINLIPFNQDELDLTLEFKSDGTIIYTDDDQTLTGTYELNGDKLSITGIDVASLPVSLSGSYDVKELTATKLIIEAERDGSFQHPDYGTISGTVKATLYFDKVN